MNNALKIILALAAAFAAVAGALLVVKKFFLDKSEPLEVLEFDCTEEELLPEEQPAEEPEASKTETGEQPTEE